MGTIWAEVGLDYKALSEGMRESKKQVNEFDKTLRETFRDLSDTISQTGKSMSVGITVPLTAMGVFAYKTVSDLESAMANVWTITDITKGQLGAFTKEIETMSTRVPQSAKKLADGLYDAISSGIRDINEAMNVVEISAKAAMAGTTDTAIAVDALTSILNSYSMSATEAGRITDVMFRTVDRGKITFGELAGNIGQVVSTAATASIPFEQLAAAYATLTRGGINAAEASTAINQAILSIINPSEEAAGYAKQLSIEFNATALASKGFAGVLEDVYNATGGNIEALTTLFPNVRSLKGVLGLVRNEMQDYTEDINQMTNATGATEKAFSKQMQTSTAQLQLFKNEVAALGRSLGSDLLPMINSGMQAVKPLIQSFSDLSDGMKQGIVIFGILAASAGPVMTAVGGLITLMTGPAGWVVASAAVIGSVYGVVKANDEARYAVLKQAEALREQISTMRAQADTYGNQARELDSLLQNYDSLKEKSEDNADAQRELQDVVRKIAEIAPEAVTEWDKFGNAISVNADKAKEAVTLMLEARKTYLEAVKAKAEYELPRLEREAEKMKPQVDEAQKEYALANEELNRAQINKQKVSKLYDDVFAKLSKIGDAQSPQAKIITTQIETMLKEAFEEGIIRGYDSEGFEQLIKELQNDPNGVAKIMLSNQKWMAENWRKSATSELDISSNLLKKVADPYHDLEMQIAELKGQLRELEAVDAQIDVLAKKTKPEEGKDKGNGTAYKKDMDEWHKWSAKIKELSKETFGDLQKEWDTITKDLTSNDPAIQAWAQKRANSLLKAISEGLEQNGGEWLKAAEKAAEEFRSGYASLKKAIKEGESELSKDLKEFRYNVSIGKIEGTEEQIKTLEAIKQTNAHTMASLDEQRQLEVQIYQLREDLRSQNIRSAYEEYRHTSTLLDYEEQDHVEHIKRLLENEQLSVKDKKALQDELDIWIKRRDDRAKEEEKRKLKEGYQRTTELLDLSYKERAEYLSKLMQMDIWNNDERTELHNEFTDMYLKAEKEAAEKNQKLILDQAEYEVSIGKKTQAELLNDIVKSREKELEVAKKSGKDIDQAQLKVNQAIAKYNEQMRQDDKDTLDHQVRMNELSLEDRLKTIRNWLSAEDGATSHWKNITQAERRALQEQELSLQRQINEESAKKHITELGVETVVKSGSSSELKELQKTLGDAYKATLALGTAGIEASRQYEQALQSVASGLERSTKQEEELNVNRLRYEYENGVISLSKYKELLEEKLAQEEEYSSNWLAIKKELRELETNINKKAVDEYLSNLGDLRNVEIDTVREKLEAQKVYYESLGAEGQKAVETIKRALETLDKLKNEQISNDKARLQLLSIISTNSIAEQIELAKLIAETEKETEAERLDAARGYYEYLAGLISKSNRDSLPVIKNTLLEQLKAYEDAGEGSSNMAAVVIVALKLIEDQSKKTALTTVNKAIEAVDKVTQSVSSLGSLFGADSELTSGIEAFGGAIADTIKMVAQIASGDIFGAIISGLSIFSKVDDAYAKLIPSIRDSKKAFKEMSESMKESLNTLGKFNSKSLIGLTDSVKNAQADLEAWQKAAEERANAGFYKNLWWSLTSSAPDAGSEAGREAAKAFIETWSVVGSALNSGVTSGIQSGIKAFMDGTGRMITYLRDGIRSAIIDAITQAIIQGSIYKGALGKMLETLTDQISDSQWDAAQDTIRNIANAIPEVASNLENTLKDFPELLNSLFGSSSSGGRAGSSGTQIAEITGSSRDLLVEMLRPLITLDSLPVYTASIEVAIYDMRDAFLRFVGTDIASKVATTTIYNEYNINEINIIAQSDDDFDRIMSSLDKRARVATEGSGGE